MAASLLKGGVLGLAPAPVASRRSIAVAAIKSETREETSTSSKQEIYIGFPKGDYARPPGRKGRVIKDDPAKYPDREDMGPLRGVVGGWAGGETSLWQFREAIKGEGKSENKSVKGVLAPSSPVRQPQKTRWNVKTTSSAGKDAIYVGFAKDELELRKSGVQGRVIYDDAAKYPGKEDVGLFLGATGGFAGGEAALKQFAETGELRLLKPGDPAIKKQFSPLTLAFVLIFGAAGGGALLTFLLDGAEGGVSDLLKAGGN
uniref:Uncharacterized protein n=1 Tax=Chlamydomonas leiostraca TaxID=1034604 RepID=A0A7S0S335_9CHLO